MENIIVEQKNGYLKLTPKDGFVITDYVETSDKEYISSNLIYTPLDADISIYKAISIEEDNLNEENFRQKEEALRLKKDKIISKNE